MIRYEIQTGRPGVILDGDVVKKFITTKANRKAMAIVFIEKKEKKDKKDFEKYLECHKDVIAYSADYHEAGVEQKEWKR